MWFSIEAFNRRQIKTWVLKKTSSFSDIILVSLLYVSHNNMKNVSHLDISTVECAACKNRDLFCNPHLSFPVFRSGFKTDVPNGGSVKNSASTCNRDNQEPECPTVTSLIPTFPPAQNWDNKVNNNVALSRRTFRRRFHTTALINRGDNLITHKPLRHTHNTPNINKIRK